MFKYENGAQWGNARRCSYRIQCTVSGFQYFVDEVLCYRSQEKSEEDLCAVVVLVCFYQFFFFF